MTTRPDGVPTWDVHPDEVPGCVVAFHPHYTHFPGQGEPGPTPALVRALTERGLALVSGLTSRALVLSFAKRTMALHRHPDADPDGLTTIRERKSSLSTVGLEGFTTNGLAAHTERSGLPDPPRLLLVVCVRQGTVGGASVLVDGRRLYTDLAASAPDALRSLSSPTAATFGGPEAWTGPVFNHHGSGRCVVRLRQDGLAAFSPNAAPYLAALRAAIGGHGISVELNLGQGYLLDNHRWLHARTSFTGSRIMLRALGAPREPLLLRPGFDIAGVPFRLS